jgi:hypothetical protein
MPKTRAPGATILKTKSILRQRKVLRHEDDKKEAQSSL